MIHSHPSPFTRTEAEHTFAAPLSLSDDLVTLEIHDEFTTLSPVLQVIFSLDLPRLRTLSLNSVTIALVLALRSRFPALENLTLHAYTGPPCRPPIPNWKELWGADNFTFDTMDQIARGPYLSFCLLPLNIESERARESERVTHTHTHTERERERERESRC